MGTPILKHPDGKVTSLLPFRHAEQAWQLLLAIAENDPDAFVRMDAAERIIRLANDLAPEMSVDVMEAITKAGVWSMPDPERD